MILSDLTSVIEPFMLISTRLGLLIAALPVMGFEPSPRKFRAVLTVVLATGFTAGLPAYTPAPSLVLGFACEALMGVTLGITVRTILATLEVAGELMSIQMGFGFNKTVDPLTKSTSGPITRILSLIGGVLFFATGAYRSVLEILGQSFRVVPPGAANFKPDFHNLVVEAGGGMMLAGARIALPLVVVALLTQLSFGLLTKVAPQMNIWGLGFTFIIAFGFVGIIVFMPTFVLETRALLEHAVDQMESMVLAQG